MPCFLFFLTESARGPRHLVTRPGPLPLPPALDEVKREAAKEKSDRQKGVK